MPSTNISAALAVGALALVAAARFETLHAFFVEPFGERYRLKSRWPALGFALLWAIAITFASIPGVSIWLIWTAPPEPAGFLVVAWLVCLSAPALVVFLVAAIEAPRSPVAAALPLKPARNAPGTFLLACAASAVVALRFAAWAGLVGRSGLERELLAAAVSVVAAALTLVGLGVLVALVHSAVLHPRVGLTLLGVGLVVSGLGALLVEAGLTASEVILGLVLTGLAASSVGELLTSRRGEMR